MNAYARFFSFGWRDADRRVADALAPPSLDAGDRYLRESAIVRAVDRRTIALSAAWADSRAVRLSKAVAAILTGRDWASRYQSIGAVLIVAVAAHLVLMLVQGERPGWFWLIIPAMAALFAVVLLTASGNAGSTD